MDDLLDTVSGTCIIITLADISYCNLQFNLCHISWVIYELYTGDTLLSGKLVSHQLPHAILEFGVHEDMINTKAEGSVTHFRPLVNPCQLLYKGYLATIIPNLLQLVYDGHYHAIMSTLDNYVQFCLPDS